jgi:hypothetical protein
MSTERAEKAGVSVSGDDHGHTDETCANLSHRHTPGWPPGAGCAEAEPAADMLLRALGRAVDSARAARRGEVSR